MFLSGNRYVRVLILATLRNFAFASSDSTVVNEQADFSKIFASLQIAVSIAAKSTTLQENASLCTRDIASVWEGATAGEKWALQMLDAGSKMQAGILKGNVHGLGMYDQCLEVEARRNHVNMKGQHCMVSLSVPPNLFGDASPLLLMQRISPIGQSADGEISFTSSVCLPGSCSEEDVFRIVSGIIDRTPEFAKPGISVAQVTCSRLTNDDLTLGGILTITFIGGVVSFLVFCTICEFVQRTRRNGSSSTLKKLSTLSLYTNTMYSLSTEVKPGTMPAIHGIRVLSMCWVIIVHRCFITAISPIANSADVLEWQNRWYAIFAFMISFTVDTSFVVSGFLTTHQFLKAMHSGQKFHLSSIYLHRYVRLAVVWIIGNFSFIIPVCYRLTPCIAAVILLTIFYLSHVGSGPVWNHSIGIMVRHCRENWWTNLLYMQNIINPHRMCLPHTWHLATDMQLFWISRIILYGMVRWPKYARRILSVFLFGSMVTSPVLFATNGHTSAFFKLTKESSISEFRHNFVNAYMSTIHRSSAYMIGVALGYVVVIKKPRFTMLQVTVNWVAACLLMSLCVFATQHLYSDSYVYDVVFESAYAALARPAWSVAVAWIIYACTQGYGGLVTEFLSTPAFLPLSGLSYCIYLVHLVMQVSIAAAARTPIVLSKFQIFHLFWGDLAISIGLGFVLSLFFEIPAIALERILKGDAPHRITSTGKSSKLVLEEYSRNAAKSE